MGIPLEAIPDRYLEIEKQMLQAFFAFAEAQSGVTWLHWNMRDHNFGFQALEDRFRLLGGAPTEVSDASKVDLSRQFIEIYGDNYIEHRRLEKISVRNNLSLQDFLSGQAEAKAFTTSSFGAINRSTVRKVKILCQLAQKAADGELKTNAPWHARLVPFVAVGIFGMYFFHALDILGQLASIMSFILTLV